MKRGNRTGISFGTIVFLGVTAGVIILAVVFLLRISGTDISEWHTQGTRNSPDEEQMIWPEDEMMLPEEATEGEAEQATGTEGQPVEQTPRKLTICFGGDITAPKSVREPMISGQNEYDFSLIFRQLGDVFLESDISLATLETMTDDTREYDSYNAPSSLLDTLKYIGIQYLNLATEHILDYDDAGLQITKAELTRRGLSFNGSVDSDSASAFPMFTANGIKVAVLAYTYGLSDEGKKASEQVDPAALPVYSPEKAVNDIVSARARGANLVIVLPHWGIKNKGEVTDAMRNAAAELSRAGADMIIGTHSNVVSEMEILRTERADGRIYETLVCYSIGALLMDARDDANSAGMILSVQLEFDPEQRQIRCLKREAVPLFIYQTVREGVRIWQVASLQDETVTETMSADVRARAVSARERIAALSAGIEVGK